MSLEGGVLKPKLGPHDQGQGPTEGLPLGRRARARASGQTLREERVDDQDQVDEPPSPSSSSSSSPSPSSPMAALMQLLLQEDRISLTTPETNSVYESCKTRGGLIRLATMLMRKDEADMTAGIGLGPRPKPAPARAGEAPPTPARHRWERERIPRGRGSWPCKTHQGLGVEKRVQREPATPTRGTFCERLYEQSTNVWVGVTSHDD